mmetsp:Transcript_11990/g.19890  ORF Transcript_11990/g.19890 Transcript_11990/m.19890 type:complete len:122 (+) Transcript_11990:47-412(+)|eukprot:CAMPEP_0119003520 /NCGR_PEP_ID=MMETSP1176-20130426/610_1 /TAXON_ID=265551 /ORGANISM="Synedropsis recta cf, Strain CCMP1620" /LENGTH=121 /DNA_ID=CAMNT_0006955131 /DNA_START=47 /DNA_END=412 /DNA_ORIENTATION=-
MLHRAILPFLFLACRLATSNAFVAVTPPRLLLSSMQRLATEESVNEDDPIECFVVNDQLVATEGEAPVVVCTSEPDEYAWFNGLDPKAMRPTDGMEEGAVECVEGASPRGIPEWECKQDDE